MCNFSVQQDVECVFLFQAKELALKSVNPHLMTIATLTGHAYLTTGPGYSVSRLRVYFKVQLELV